METTNQEQMLLVDVAAPDSLLDGIPRLYRGKVTYYSIFDLILIHSDPTTNLLLSPIEALGWLQIDGLWSLSAKTGYLELYAKKADAFLLYSSLTKTGQTTSYDKDSSLSVDITVRWWSPEDGCFISNQHSYPEEWIPKDVILHLNQNENGFAPFMGDPRTAEVALVYDATQCIVPQNAALYELKQHVWIIRPTATSCVLRGFPYAYKEQQVLEFLTALGLDAHKIKHLELEEHRQNRRFTGYVELVLESKNELDFCKQKVHGAWAEERWIEVLPQKSKYQPFTPILLYDGNFEFEGGNFGLCEHPVRMVVADDECGDRLSWMKNRTPSPEPVFWYKH